MAAMSTSSGPSCVVAPRNVCIVRWASGVTMMSERAVGSPPTSGAVSYFTPTARRNPRDGVPRRSARGFLAGTHVAVQPLSRLGVDEVHRALRQLVLVEERIVGLGDHVDDGVADRGDIELRGAHSVVLEVAVGR